jgi:gliding motility associated protien GldN
MMIRSFLFLYFSLGLFCLYGQPGSYKPVQNTGPLNIPHPQDPPGTDGIVDGVFVKTEVPTKKMINYEFVREADYVWAKRTWSYIDLREKFNFPLYYPHEVVIDNQNVEVVNAQRYSLWLVIKKLIMEAKVTPFYPKDKNLFVFAGKVDASVFDGYDFKYPCNTKSDYWNDKDYKKVLDEEFLSTAKSVTVAVKAEDGSDSTVEVIRNGVVLDSSITEEKIIKTSFTSKLITRYYLKTDWFFDKERSLLDHRIIALAPAIYDSTEKKHVELFWLYFPHLRPYLQNYYTYNDKNDAQWMSYDDLFWKTKYTQVFYRESNIYDRKIESYAKGIDALIEAERIKEEIRTFEHDVWNF